MSEKVQKSKYLVEVEFEQEGVEEIKEENVLEKQILRNNFLII
ncbi:MAG: hypothetical protein ACFE94_16155 [Candidatus Hodarchaeota archaeon]